MARKQGRGSAAMRRGNARALKRAVEGVEGAAGSRDESLARKRRMVADFCQLLGEGLTGRPRPGAVVVASPAPAAGAVSPDPAAGLTPRVRQTLDRLLHGDSEKEIARHLGVSPHTVHAYVKALYLHFRVSSRGELLARFVTRI